MLEAWMTFGQRLVEVTLVAYMLGSTKTPLTLQERQSLITKIAVPGLLWEPDRILDERSRDAAAAYWAALTDLRLSLYFSQLDPDELTAKGSPLDDLRKSVCERMDELKWAEVDNHEKTS